MSYFEKDWYTIVRKHYFIFLFFLFKFLFFLVITWVIFGITFYYHEFFPDNVRDYLFLPIILFLLNYAFIKLILNLIEYYNYLFIIFKDQIYIINASLIFRNDIEVIDAFKIIKIDAFCRWFIANLFWFWYITIELQTREERTFRFMPDPYILLEKLKVQREEVLKSRKEKYLLEREIQDLEEVKNTKK